MFQNALVVAFHHITTLVEGFFKIQMKGNIFQHDSPLKHVREVVDGTGVHDVTNKFFKH